MRFALTVPPGTTPAAGWPICIYAHGTGGDYRSFIDDGTALRLAKQGIAVISTDQVLHGMAVFDAVVRSAQSGRIETVE